MGLGWGVGVRVGVGVGGTEVNRLPSGGSSRRGYRGSCSSLAPPAGVLLKAPRWRRWTEVHEKKHFAL